MVVSNDNHGTKGVVDLAISLSLCSLNVRSLNIDRKRKEIFDFFYLKKKKNEAQIIFLQETHCADANSSSVWSKEWKGDSRWSSGNIRSSGVGILFSADIDDIFDCVIHDSVVLSHPTSVMVNNVPTNVDVLAHRALAVLISIAVGSSRQFYCLLNIYAPSDSYSSRSVFFSSVNIAMTTQLLLWDLLFDAKGSISTIMAGDFNVPISPTADTSSLSAGPSNRADRVALQLLCEDLLVEDVPSVADLPLQRKWTYQASNMALPAVPSSVTLGTRSRIDMILLPINTSSNRMDFISALAAVATGISGVDHRMVSFTVGIRGALTLGPGRFQTNTSLLAHSNLIDLLSTKWTAHQSSRPPVLTPLFLNWWQDGKRMLKSILREYAMKVVKKRLLGHERSRRRHGDASLGAAVVDSMNLNSNDHADQYATLETKRAIAGIKIRTGYANIPVDDIFDKAFFAQEKARGAASMVHSIVDEISHCEVGAVPISIGSDQPQLLVGQVRRFYASLYSERCVLTDSQISDSASEFFRCHRQETISRKRFARDHAPERIVDEVNMFCDIEFTLQKSGLDDPLLSGCVQVIPSGSACGEDGISHMVYLSIWDTIRDDLAAWIRTAVALRSFGDNISIIRPFHKSGPKNKLSNWRPLSMINSDLKIAGHVLNKSLSRCAPLLIHRDQVGFTKKRDIGECILLLQMVMRHWSSIHNALGVVALLDFKKAFDSMNRKYMRLVLQNSGFTGDVLALFDALYHNTYATVMVNGFQSMPFLLTRSSRQGCPASPSLWLLFLEPLAAKLRSLAMDNGLLMPRMVGVSLTPLIVSLFADDTTLFARDLPAMSRSIDVVTDFGEFSGAELNFNKSAILPLGDTDSRQTTYTAVTTNLVFATSLAKFMFIHDGVAFRHLGAMLGYACELDVEKYWNKVENSMMSNLGRWFHTPTTLRSRVVVLKSMVLSQLWYPLCFTTISPVRLSRLQYAVYRFLWKKIPMSASASVRWSPAVSAMKVSLSLRNGGLDLWSISSMISAFRIKWYLRMIYLSNPVQLENPFSSSVHWAFLVRMLILPNLASLPMEVHPRATVSSWLGVPDSVSHAQQTLRLFGTDSLIASNRAAVVGPVWTETISVWAEYGRFVRDKCFSGSSALRPHEWNSGSLHLCSVAALRHIILSVCWKNAHNDRSFDLPFLVNQKFWHLGDGSPLLVAWSTLWSSPGVLPSCRDLIWRSLHGSLQTSHRRSKQWPAYRYDPSCYNCAPDLCSRQGTIPPGGFPSLVQDTAMHVLFTCPSGSAAVWELITPVIDLVANFGLAVHVPIVFGLNWLITGNSTSMSPSPRASAITCLNFLRSLGICTIFSAYTTSRLSLLPTWLPVHDVFLRWRQSVKDLLMLQWLQSSASARREMVCTYAPLIISSPPFLSCSLHLLLS